MSGAIPPLPSCLRGVFMVNLTFILPRILTNKYGIQAVKPLWDTAVEVLYAVETLISSVPALQIKEP